jgi:hypothetical protein
LIPTPASRPKCRRHAARANALDERDDRIRGDVDLLDLAGLSAAAAAAQRRLGLERLGRRLANFAEARSWRRAAARLWLVIAPRVRASAIAPAIIWADALACVAVSAVSALADPASSVVSAVIAGSETFATLTVLAKLASRWPSTNAARAAPR